MNFSVIRMCGGKALIASSSEQLNIDLNHASNILAHEGFKINKNDAGLMLIMNWKEMEITLYPQGKVMFFPLTEKEMAIEYASMIINKVNP